MEQRFRRQLLLAVALSTSTAGSVASPPLPIEDLARYPVIQSVSMSADGKRLVALVSSPDGKTEPALANWDLDDLAAGPKRVTPSGERMKFVAAIAMKAGRTLAIARQEWTGRLAGCGEGNATGATKTFVSKAYITDVAQEKFDEAFASSVRRAGISDDTQRCFEIGGSADLVHGLPLEPDHVIVRQSNPSSLSADYYRYNLKTGATELLLRADAKTSPGLFHPRSGELLTRETLESAGPDEFEARTQIKDSRSGAFVTHDALTVKVSERVNLSVVGVDDDTGKLYILTDKFSDHMQAWAYDPATQTFDKEPLVAHAAGSITRLHFDTRSATFNKITGYVVNTQRAETVYVDPQLNALHDGLKRAFPTRTVTVDTYNDDLSKVLFITDSPADSPAYHILVNGKDVVALGSEQPWIDPARIGEQRWVVYTARDGLKIPAVLDLPAGWKPGDAPLPAIVHPHGGPWARDSTGWDHGMMVPFLTTRGYAVLRPNYRGSTGLGRALTLAGDREWGQKMQDDKDDGAAWMVSQGIAAKDRIAIYGYSYGGFAAAAAVVRSPSPYQCAVSGAPVTDLAKLSHAWGDSRVQRIGQGKTVAGMDPMRNTDKAALPVLLFVGDRDVRTPAFHARNFHNAVKDRVSSTFVLIRDMPHGMPWYPRHVEESFGLVERFLKNDCGAGGL